MQQNIIRVYSDASYHDDNRGYGFGAVIIQESVLRQFGVFGVSQKHEPCSAMWEFRAIQHALTRVRRGSNAPVHIFTDCKQVVVRDHYHAELCSLFPWLNIERIIHRSDHACGHMMTCHMIANKVRKYRVTHYRQVLLPHTA